MDTTMPVFSHTGAQAPTGRSKTLARACADFEALFLQQLFARMRATVPRSELSGGGQAEALYTEMLDGELARSMAQGRGIGLAEMMYRQIMEKAPKD
jgi:flagellar protein FlgJ